MQILAGIDEVGRGALAGPVVSSCVILPKRWKYKTYLNDSKKLSQKKRTEFAIEIKKSCKYGIGYISNTLIDGLGIRLATHLSMIQALNNLMRDFDIVPDKLMIDGRDHFLFAINSQYIIKGDTKIPEIMAASILAKVERDNFMSYLETKPIYNFSKHKGYGTKEHTTSIIKHGSSDIHRNSFIQNFI